MKTSAWRLLTLPAVLLGLLMVGTPNFDQIAALPATAPAPVHSVDTPEPAADADTRQLALPTVLSLESEDSEPAQEKRGMSSWAFWFAQIGQAADVITTEVALSRGLVESNNFLQSRTIRMTKLALPLLTKFMLRKTNRTDANVNAIILGAWGAGPAAWNIHATMKWGR